MVFINSTYRLTESGERIDGVVFLAFIFNAIYHLTDIRIYQDGMIDCWGLITFEEFKLKVRSGWVVTQPPPNAEVSIAFLASFTATDAHYWIEPEEFIKEVADAIEGLNQRSTTEQRCLAAWTAFLASPTNENKEALRVAYEAVPAHNRKYVLGDQGRKDHPIRRVLYPEQYRDSN